MTRRKVPVIGRNRRATFQTLEVPRKNYSTVMYARRIASYFRASFISEEQERELHAFLGRLGAPFETDRMRGA
jgi:hypothetical protein